MKRMSMRPALMICAALALLMAGLAAWADEPAVRAWLDRDTMQLGETVTLNVQVQGGSGAQPDFSALKQDFNLIGTQSSQQISVAGSVSSTKTLWAVGLEPKHAGRITIAPIAVGRATTQPIVLNVLDQPAQAQSRVGDDVFLEVTAEPLAPYVQQQVRYTVKLYYVFDLTDGNLNEPQADGLGVQRLGQDKAYNATLGGRRYHVVERHYALTPERSGAIEIPGLAFRGTALDVTDPTGFFSRGRSVSAHSDAVRLDVRPKPAEWAGDPWLPAASVLLKDEGDLPDEVHVGDPVTRTIRLQAQGLGYEQLPELDLKAPPGAEIYPDKADTRTRDDGEWLYGERVRKFAFVPNKPGTLTIPGLTVRWWDTVHDRAETAQLPARTITVLPASGAAADGASAAPAPQAGVAVRSEPAPPAGVAAGATAARAPRLWQGLALLGFALWLGTLALWWRERRRPSTSPVQPPAPPRTDASAPRAAFLRACALADLAGAERALIAWARHERPDVRNLGEFAQRLADAAQREALADLQRTRYAGAPGDGLAVRLQQAFRKGLAWRDAGRPAPASAPPLPELYPTRE